MVSFKYLHKVNYPLLTCITCHCPFQSCPTGYHSAWAPCSLCHFWSCSVQAGQDLPCWEVQLQAQNKPNKKQTLIILCKDFGCRANGLLEEFSMDPNKVRLINPIKVTANPIKVASLGIQWAKALWKLCRHFQALNCLWKKGMETSARC